MFFNDAGIELLLYFEQETRRMRATPVHRPHRLVAPAPPAALATRHDARHPVALWLAERLVECGERLRAWSSPEPVCPVGK